ncbi:hypothetical protein D3C87_1956560 [compost metagenome]
MRAGIVREAEGADDELARLDGLDRTADFNHHAAIFMAHGERRGDFVGAAIGPQIRSADAGCGQFDDGIRRLEDLRLGDFLAANVAGTMENCRKHYVLPSDLNFVVGNR